MELLVSSLVVALSVIFSAHILGRYLIMAFNKDQLNAGLQAVADALLELANAIARPHADLAEAQRELDDTGTKLQSLALDLKNLKAAEDVEDAVPAPEPQPEEPQA